MKTLGFSGMLDTFVGHDIRRVRAGVHTLLGVAGEDAEEGGFALLGLGDGGFDELAEFGGEVFAEVLHGGVAAKVSAASPRCAGPVKLAMEAVWEIVFRC